MESLQISYVHNLCEKCYQFGIDILFNYINTNKKELFMTDVKMLSLKYFYCKHEDLHFEVFIRSEVEASTKRLVLVVA